MPARVPHLADLADLAALRDRLTREARDRAERDDAARRAQAEAEVEVNLFRRTVGDVEPLKAAPRIEHHRARPEPIAHQTRRDEAEAFRESVSDDFDVDVALESDEQISWRREGMSLAVLEKLRRGHWIIQSELDLHGYVVDAARVLVADFLRESMKRQLRCVRIVHGKGHGSAGKMPVLKGKVKRWLTQKDEVLAFCQAREHDGGGGALIVLLRPS